ncbi:MAG: metallopeptidase family protein [Myxococcaceae bacterium]
MTPTDAEHGIVDAEDAVTEGDYERALSMAEDALGQDPRSTEWIELKAEALAGLDRFEEAADLYAELSEKSPKDGRLQLMTADLLVRTQDPELARDALDRLERAEKKAKGQTELFVELLRIRAEAHDVLEEPHAVLQALEQAWKLMPDSPGLRLDRALAMFETAKFDEARRELTGLAATEPLDAWPHHFLGLIAERRGDAGTAERELELARKLDPESFPKPVKLSDSEWSRAVAHAIDALPEHAKELMGNTTVTFLPLPADQDLQGGDLSPTMLGIFRGTPIPERNVLEAAHHLTAEIVLFQRNLERAVRSKDELFEQIDVTVLHEVGHLLGLDEEDLWERGLD